MAGPAGWASDCGPMYVLRCGSGKSNKLPNGPQLDALNQLPLPYQKFSSTMIVTYDALIGDDASKMEVIAVIVPSL